MQIGSSVWCIYKRNTINDINKLLRLWERRHFGSGDGGGNGGVDVAVSKVDRILLIAIHYSHVPRWIKFEEKVEQGGERWSKPHVATLSLHSLFELRTCMEKGSIMLDREATSLPQLVGKYIVVSLYHFFSAFLSIHESPSMQMTSSVSTVEYSRTFILSFLFYKTSKVYCRKFRKYRQILRTK